jgi:ABC-type proline/glycine betaine transport system permease subunit
VLHGLIDFAKIKINKNNVWVYVGDQVLHVISLVVLWLFITENTLGQLIAIGENYEWSDQYLIVCLAFIAISHPSGVLIGYLTKAWQDELEADGNESLKNAGKWIGIIERILILTFILINEWAPIGFLLAAKSVFRFGDLKEGKEHKKTEYILIGTLLSFTLAILLGILLQGVIP